MGGITHPKGNQDYNPIWMYLGESPTEFSGVYFGEDVYRIVLLAFNCLMAQKSNAFLLHKATQLQKHLWDRR